MRNNVWERIEASRERWDVLRHPFYRRWSAGELSAEELERYSGQYRHAVVAIADLSGRAAAALPDRSELEAHAAEERDHVVLWDGFVEATGGDNAAAATPQTRACTDAWAGPGEPLELLARLYAIESGQPAISITKRDGLLGSYGFDDGKGTAYFRVHSSRDAEHAAEVRELIESVAAPADEDAIVAAAEGAFRANWRLLDGVV
jgi:pyrroloquinoline quinone (PQQ) biosynthesis protein C